MAEYHVRAGGDGGSLPSLVAAAQVARPGDVVVVHSGVYEGGFVPPAGTTWTAAPGEQAVIDGGWRGQPTSEAEGKANGVLIRNPGVTLRGMEIRNVRGKGVAVGAGGDRFVMENCEIHHTTNGGFGANGTGTTIHDLTIRNCYMHHLSLSGRWYETPVNGCCLFRYVDGLNIEELRIRFGCGEGLALGPFTRNAKVKARIEDTVHLAVYASNRARDVLFEDCVVIQRGLDEWRQGDGHVGSGFVIGDEVSGDKTAKWPHADNITLRNCITINAGACVEVRNQRKTAANGNPDGYDTRPDSLLVENCTFIAGPDTRRGVVVAENEWGGQVRGTFRKNLFVLDRMAEGGAALRSNAAGVRFDDNAWSGGVPAALPGSNHPVAASALVAPFATLDGDLNLDNYRPMAGGPLDGAGYGALAAGPDGPEPPVEPPPPDPPDDPEPPPATVDWPALRALAAEATAESAAAHVAADKAVCLLQTLDNRMREYEVAAQGGEE